MAKLERIVPDPTAVGMYLALIELGSYMLFEAAAPFSDENGLLERGLLNDVGAISGRAQAAVRPISLQNFNRIIDRAFIDDPTQLPRVGEADSSVLREDRSTFIYEVERDRISYLT